jgi:6-pyruvoyl tetrahydropterin synthase/QueD family protein
MYTIRKSLDIDFAHNIEGHRGACINVHGHTWKFEVEVSASTLDEEGFVVDFKRLKQEVLEPCHRLLDHSLALGARLYGQVEPQLKEMGSAFLASRITMHGEGIQQDRGEEWELFGAKGCYPGGMKVAILPFSPTSERLAKWLYGLAAEQLNDERVRVSCARIYETLHPVESVAEYRPQ